MRTLFLLLICLMGITGKATTLQYEKSDSIKVVRLLSDGKKQPKRTNLILYFARRLLGVPYVAHTLDQNKDEQLVINLRQLDCTTYVENVLALTLCIRNGRTSFADFCHYLMQIRYRNGQVALLFRMDNR